MQRVTDRQHLLLTEAVDEATNDLSAPPVNDRHDDEQCGERGGVDIELLDQHEWRKGEVNLHPAAIEKRQPVIEPVLLAPGNSRRRSRERPMVVGNGETKNKAGADDGRKAADNEKGTQRVVLKTCQRA